jgi:hypothetical protein
MASARQLKRIAKFAKRLAAAKRGAEYTSFMLEISEMLHAKKDLPERSQRLRDAIDMYFSGEVPFSGEENSLFEVLKSIPEGRMTDKYGLTLTEVACLAAVYPQFCSEEDD